MYPVKSVWCFWYVAYVFNIIVWAPATPTPLSLLCRGCFMLWFHITSCRIYKSFIPLCFLTILEKRKMLISQYFLISFFFRSLRNNYLYDDGWKKEKLKYFLSFISLSKWWLFNFGMKPLNWVITDMLMLNSKPPKQIFRGTCFILVSHFVLL